MFYPLSNSLPYYLRPKCLCFTVYCTIIDVCAACINTVIMQCSANQCILHCLDYRDELFRSLENCINSHTKPTPLPAEPPTLASTGEQITKAELEERQKSRPGITTKRHYVDDPTPEENRRCLICIYMLIGNF